jgi:hypothetical protein
VGRKVFLYQPNWRIPSSIREIQFRDQGMSKVNFKYQEIPRGDIYGICQSLDKAGAHWHIHSLTPGCQFNPVPNQYCFVVENTDTLETVCAFSDHSFYEECHAMVQLLHGAEILDAGELTGNPPEAEILIQVQDCVAKGESWHHHMMMPDCVLSPTPESHVITLERASRNTIFVHEDADAPDNILREIEIIYFAQNK